MRVVARRLTEERDGLPGYIAHPIRQERGPTRLNEAQGVLNAASNPYASLLWLEFICSPTGQQVIDQYEPFGASLLTAGSVQEKVTRGLKLSMVDWDHVTKMEDYQ